MHLPQIYKYTTADICTLIIYDYCLMLYNRYLTPSIFYISLDSVSHSSIDGTHPSAMLLLLYVLLAVVTYIENTIKNSNTITDVNLYMIDFMDII